MVACHHGSLILGSLEAIYRVHPERIVLIIVPIIMACLNYNQTGINLQEFF